MARSFLHTYMSGIFEPYRADQCVWESHQPNALNAQSVAEKRPGETAKQNVPDQVEGEPKNYRREPAVAKQQSRFKHIGQIERLKCRQRNAIPVVRLDVGKQVRPDFIERHDSGKNPEYRQPQMTS